MYANLRTNTINHEATWQIENFTHVGSSIEILSGASELNHARIYERDGLSCEENVAAALQNTETTVDMLHHAIIHRHNVARLT